MEPVMIRVYQGGNKGATAFFRNRAFLQTLLESLEQLGQRQVRVLVHAASIGAEPYSLAMYYLHRRRTDFGLQILATDINPHFLAAAAAGAYAGQVAKGLSDEERGWFVQEGATLRIPEEAKALVQFLSPMDFVRDRPEGEFDATLIMNALTYVTPEQQRMAIAAAAERTRHLLALTAFHPDSIRSDLSEVGFEPVLANHEAIHRSWGDRLSTGPIDPASSAYSWKIPPYDPGHPDFAYRFGSLFRRS